MTSFRIFCLQGMSAQVSPISNNLQYFISTGVSTKRCSEKQMFLNLPSKSFNDNNEDILFVVTLQAMSYFFPEHFHTSTQFL